VKKKYESGVMGGEKIENWGTKIIYASPEKGSRETDATTSTRQKNFMLRGCVGQSGAVGMGGEENRNWQKDHRILAECKKKKKVRNQWEAVQKEGKGNWQKMAHWVKKRMR